MNRFARLVALALAGSALVGGGCGSATTQSSTQKSSEASAKEGLKSTNAGERGDAAKRLGEMYGPQNPGVGK